MKIKKIKILSLAKVLAIIYGFLGLLAGAFITVMALMGADMSDPETGASNAFMGVASFIVFPILYTVIGFIGGAVTALLYNISAQWLGGIEIETD